MGKFHINKDRIVQINLTDEKLKEIEQSWINHWEEKAYSSFGETLIKNNLEIFVDKIIEFFKDKSKMTVDTGKRNIWMDPVDHTSYLLIFSGVHLGNIKIQFVNQIGKSPTFLMQFYPNPLWQNFFSDFPEKEKEGA